MALYGPLSRGSGFLIAAWTYGKALEVFDEVAKLYPDTPTANRHGFGKVSV
jgi:hypothetical protein